MLLELVDEAVAGRGLEVARVDFAGKVEEGLGVDAKVVDGEHGLRVGKIGIVDLQPRINAVLRAKVWNAARGRHLRRRGGEWEGR